MRFALTDEQQMLRQAVRGALEREASLAQVRVWCETREAREAMATAVRQGWVGIGVPEAAGGQGGGLVELALATEEIARAALPAPFLAHTGLAVPLALDAGGEIAAALVDGGRTAAVVVGSGAAPSTPAADLRVEGDALSGSVQHVLGATDVDVLIVPVSEDGAVRLRLVEPGAPGVTLQPLETTDITRNWAHVRFDRAPSEAIGQLEGDLTDIRARVAVLVAADSLGATQRMLDMTVEYAKEREQFQKPIGSFQAVKHVAAEMLVDVETTRSVVYFAAWSVANDHVEAQAHAAGAMAYGTAAGARVADMALAMHGAIGFTWEHDLQFFYKRAKANVPLFGSPASHLDHVADRLPLLPA